MTMGLDELRSILLSERETGRLTVIAQNIFDRGHAALASLVAKVYAFEDPLSDEARSMIEETLAIKETLHDLFVIRSRKILALTIMHAEGNYYDREEMKRMIPTEREMFEKITAAIEQCQGSLLQYVRPEISPVEIPDHAGAEPVSVQSEESAMVGASAPQLPKSPFSPPCVLVRVLEDMDSFMGVDGRIYTLSKGDILTLPERNAEVLSERNIVLNMNLCK